MDNIPRRASGVYAITHIASGRQYIGSSVRVRHRIIEHRSSLIRQSHHSAHLQNAWNKYGPDAFSYGILESVPDRDQLVHREQYYLDQLRPVFNIRKLASGNAAHPVSDNVRLRTSIKSKALWATPEYRSRLTDNGRMSENARQNWLDPVYRANLRASQIGNAKLIASTTRLWTQPEYLAKMRMRPASTINTEVRSAATSRLWLQPEFRAKVLRGLRRARERRSQAHAALWQNPEYRERRLQLLRVTLHSPEARQRRSEAQTGVKHSEASRLARADKMRALWADPEFRAKTMSGISVRRNPNDCRSAGRVSAALSEDCTRVDPPARPT